MAEPLEQLRARIADVDRRILAAMAERQSLALGVAETKSELGLPVKNHAVEARILENTRQSAAELGIEETAAVAVMETLIASSCRAQDRYLAAKQASPKKIFIVGAAGGMGRWLADFFRGYGHAVSGWDLKALPEGVQGQEFEAGVLGSDFIVLAAPIPVTPELISRIAALKPSGVVFDICSVKKSLGDAFRSAQAAGLKLASAHPMLGPTTALSAPAALLLCDAGSPEAVDRTEALFSGTTLFVRRLPAESHDAVMALVLGIPHLLNLAFATFLSNEGVTLPLLETAAGNTFRAQAALSLKVAGQCPELYYDIQSENGATLSSIEALKATLAGFERAIQQKDRAGFRALMESGHRFLAGDTK